MSKFTIINDNPKMRGSIMAELLADDEGDLRLKINGYLVLYINEKGVITYMRDAVSPLTGAKLQIENHVLLNED